MGGIQTGLTDAQLLASQLKAHELTGMKSSASEIDNMVLISGGGGGSSIPIGSIIQMKTNTAPDGYLICDGSVVDISVYPELMPYLKNITEAGADMFDKSQMTATASSEAYNSFMAQYVLDNQKINSFPYWQCENYDPEPYLIIDAAIQITPVSYALYGEMNYGIIAWQLLGSNDNSSWNILDDRSDRTSNIKVNEYFVIENPGSYRYFKFVITTNNILTIVKEVDFFATDESVNSYYLPTKEEINQSQIQNEYNFLIKAK